MAWDGVNVAEQHNLPLSPTPDAHRVAGLVDKRLIIPTRSHGGGEIGTGCLFLGGGTGDADQFSEEFDILVHHNTSATWATTVSTSSWVMVSGGKKRNTVTPAARAMIPRSMRPRRCGATFSFISMPIISPRPRPSRNF